jgi:hypothetical protein
MTYFLAAAAASGIFILAGWRGKSAEGLVTVQGRHGLPIDPQLIDPLHGTETDAGAVSPCADVGATMRLALKRLGPIMGRHSMQAEFAMPSGLLVRMRGGPLADLLDELLTAAIHSAPASRLLLTATTHGDRVYVGITDDMPGADPAIRLQSVRSLTQRVAMRGGTLDVNVCPAEGTTMTLRLAAATGAGKDGED